MESNVDEHDSMVVPVPKPRRHNVNTNTNLNNNKLAYENVSIDLINKNINIKEENMQNNAKNKLQTNKLFLMPNTSTAASPSPSSSSSSSNNINETSSSSSVNSGGSTQILTNLNDLANAPSKNQKNLSTIQLDEINKLSNIYNDDENVNVKPVPAPRRANAAPSNVKQFNCTASTGAISKQSTAFDINDFLESPKAKSKHNKNKNKGSYSFGADDECDATGSEDFVRKYSLKKHLSNSSLSSSQSGSSSADPSGSKYHSASPG